MAFPTIPLAPTEPSPMPDPCSGDLDAVMLGKTLSLQACRQAVGQAADLETWTNESDMGPQGDQWRLVSRQGLVAMDGGRGLVREDSELNSGWARQDITSVVAL